MISTFISGVYLELVYSYRSVPSKRPCPCKHPTPIFYDPMDHVYIRVQCDIQNMGINYAFSLSSFILEQQYHSLPPTQTMITHRPLLSLVTALSLLGVALFYLHVCCHRPPKKLKRPIRNAAIRKQQRARGQPQNNVRRRGRQEQGGAGSSSGTGTDSVDQSHSEPESSKDK